MTSLLIPAAIICVALCGLWLVSVIKRDAGIVDIFWGPGFAALAWLYVVYSDAPSTRGLVVAALVTLWGVRLGTHIFVRGRGHGEDYRYAAMRAGWGPRFWWVSLFTVFLLQGVLMVAISVPLWRVQGSAAPPLGPMDIGGLVLFAIGFFFEAVGDWQLRRFKADPNNRGKPLATGLWRYTRHPNYFGDALLWWGLFALALPADGWFAIYSPILMTFLLLRVSGVTLLEKKLRETRAGYLDYAARTNAFFPWFPKAN